MLFSVLVFTCIGKKGSGETEIVALHIFVFASESSESFSLSFDNSRTFLFPGNPSCNLTTDIDERRRVREENYKWRINHLRSELSFGRLFPFIPFRL